MSRPETESAVLFLFSVFSGDPERKSVFFFVDCFLLRGGGGGDEFCLKSAENAVPTDSVMKYQKTLCLPLTHSLF